MIHSGLAHCVVPAGRNATFNLVPTPSAELMSTGFFQPEAVAGAEAADIGQHMAGEGIARRFLTEETARSASSMLTPAS
jgi:hypothetical protein